MNGPSPIAASRRVDGVSLAVVEAGAGTPVVLVHGSASDYRTWSAVIADLARDHHVIAYSRRHHWPNEPIAPGADYAMGDHVDDLGALLRSLDLGPVHLVGHSYGAFVALLLALREPAALRSLVLAEPPAVTLFGGTPPRPAEILKLLLTRPRTALALMDFGARGIAPATAAARRGDMRQAMRVFGRAVLGRRKVAAMSRERWQQVTANAIAAEFTGSGLPPLEDDRLRGLAVPVLLVGGEESPAIFARLLDRLEELLPHNERRTIAAASHIMHEDDPGACLAALRAFFARQAGGIAARGAAG